MSNHSHTSGQSTSDWLVGAVKSNPEGLLLLAAGCALLLRSAGLSGRSNYSSGRQVPGQGGTRGQSTVSGMTENLSQAADSARDYASELGKTVSDKASAYASTAADYADGARRTIVDQSERLVEQARTTMQSTIGRVLQEQPLALAVAGLAAGAAVAAAFPATAVERQALGEAGERLSEAASNVGKNLSQAASKAGEKLMSVADERGLNAEGLKEVASDVASTFGDAFSGNKDSRGSQSSGSTGMNQGGSAAAKPSQAFGQGSGQSDRSTAPGTTKQS